MKKEIILNVLNVEGKNIENSNKRIKRALSIALKSNIVLDLMNQVDNNYSYQLLKKLEKSFISISKFKSNKLKKVTYKLFDFFSYDDFVKIIKRINRVKSKIDNNDLLRKVDLILGSKSLRSYEKKEKIFDLFFQEKNQENSKEKNQENSKEGNQENSKEGNQENKIDIKKLYQTLNSNQKRELLKLLQAEGIKI